MWRDQKVIAKALQRKGFQSHEGDHHYFIYHNLAGQKTMKKTKMSHGTGHKTVGDPLLGQMARQVGLSKAKFLELVDCTLDQSGYEAIVFPSP